MLLILPRKMDECMQGVILIINSYKSFSVACIGVGVCLIASIIIAICQLLRVQAFVYQLDVWGQVHEHELLIEAVILLEPA